MVAFQLELLERVEVLISHMMREGEVLMNWMLPGLFVVAVVALITANVTRRIEQRGNRLPLAALIMTSPWGPCLWRVMFSLVVVGELGMMVMSFTTDPTTPTTYYLGSIGGTLAAILAIIGIAAFGGWAIAQALYAQYAVDGRPFPKFQRVIGVLFASIFLLISVAGAVYLIPNFIKGLEAECVELDVTIASVNMPQPPKDVRRYTPYYELTLEEFPGETVVVAAYRLAGARVQVGERLPVLLTKREGWPVRIKLRKL